MPLKLITIFLVFLLSLQALTQCSNYIFNFLRNAETLYFALVLNFVRKLREPGAIPSLAHTSSRCGTRLNTKPVVFKSLLFVYLQM
jgi:hypothetical protein